MKGKDRINNLLTVDNLLDAAGDAYFERGEGYAFQGLVEDLRFQNNRIVARVNGTHLYETAIYDDEGELWGECSCPLGQQGEFCKHLVATGLIWMASQEDDGQSPVEKPVPDEKVLEQWLHKRKKQDLIKIITKRCNQDGDFFDQLVLTARGSESTGDLKELKSIIQKAYRIHGFIEWNRTHEYYSKLNRISAILQDMLDTGRAEAVIELTEYAMKRWETAIQHIDDSDGGMGMALDDLHEIHLSACQKARPDPMKLAERLFKQSLKSSWDIFDQAYAVYEDVFGAEGRKRYRDLVEREWEKLPKLGPHEEDPNRYGSSRWLSELMVAFAQEDGDFERELEIRQRNLSSTLGYDEIARRCEEEAQPERAIEWLREGLRHFKDRNRHLKEHLSDLLWKQRNYDEALAIRWDIFAATPRLGEYQELIKRAKKRKQLDHWRDKALERVRQRIDSDRGRNPKRYWEINDASLLVSILLWEGDVEQAWREAVAGGCSEQHWLNLCKKRQSAHPDECFPVYLRIAATDVAKGNNDAYHSAVEKIQTARSLAKACGQMEKFNSALEEIKTEYKRKRNFMKYLGEAGL